MDGERGARGSGRVQGVMEEVVGDRGRQGRWRLPVVASVAFFGLLVGSLVGLLPVVASQAGAADGVEEGEARELALATLRAQRVVDIAVSDSTFEVSRQSSGIDKAGPVSGSRTVDLSTTEERGSYGPYVRWPAPNTQTGRFEVRYNGEADVFYPNTRDASVCPPWFSDCAGAATSTRMRVKTVAETDVQHVSGDATVDVRRGASLDFDFTFIRPEEDITTNANGTARKFRAQVDLNDAVYDVDLSSRYNSYHPSIGSSNTVTSRYVTTATVRDEDGESHKVEVTTHYQHVVVLFGSDDGTNRELYDSTVKVDGETYDVGLTGKDL